MVVFLCLALLWKQGLHSRWGAWGGRWITFCFQACHATPSCRSQASSQNNNNNNNGKKKKLSALLALTFKLVFVCPVFSEAAWWNPEVWLTASRRRCSGLGIKKPLLCDTVESRCLLMWTHLAHTVRYSQRNEGIITLIMSDTQICKHTLKCENFISCPLIFLSVSVSLFIPTSSSPTQLSCF